MKNIQSRKSGLLIGTVCTLISFNAFAIFSHYSDISWNTSVTDGDWAQTTSWSGGVVPTSSEAAKFQTKGEYNITLSENKNVAAFWAQSYYGTLKIRLNFGSYTLTGPGTGYRNQFLVFGTTGTDVELTSGKISNFAAVNLATWNDKAINSAEHKNNRFALSGAGTTFYCAGGKEATRIGGRGNNNKFEVLDGAEYRAGSSTIIGENSNTATLNTLRVSGEGSAYRTYQRHHNSYNNWLPKYGTQNSVIVENGGLFYNNGDSNADTHSIYTAYNSDAKNNEFIVRGEGSRVNLTTSFYHGLNGSDNLLAITNKARMNVKYNFIVGCSSTAKRNKVLVADESIFSNHYHIVVGDAAASSNEFTVTGAGSLVKNTLYDITVGNNADYNTLRVANGAYLYSHRHFCVGGPANMKVNSSTSTSTSARSTGNKAIFEGVGTGAYLSNDNTDIGWAGTNNLFIVRDGASVTNNQSLRIGWYSNLATGNGAIVSNAYLRINRNLYVNNYGQENFFIAKDGAKVVYYIDIRMGESSTASRNGLISISGEGTLLTYGGDTSGTMQIGAAGSDNVFEIKDGAEVALNGQMYIGSYSSNQTSNNWIKLFNGKLSNNNAARVALNLYKKSGFSFGGSNAEIDVERIIAHRENSLEFVFDENGIAPLEARNPLCVLDDNFVPTITNITVDATAYVNAKKFGRFNLIKDSSNRSCQTISVPYQNLSGQSSDVIAQANATLLSRIVCIPNSVEVTNVDLSRSILEVRIKNVGLAIILK